MTIESQKTSDLDRNFENKIWKAFNQSQLSIKLSPATIKCQTWLESCQSQIRSVPANFFQHVYCEVCTIENQKI